MIVCVFRLSRHQSVKRILIFICNLHLLVLGVLFYKITGLRCPSGCVVECRICNWEVAGSNLGLGYFAPRSTQPSIPPGR